MTNPEFATQQEQGVVLDESTTFEQLTEALIKAGIPVDEFGQGKAKTILHLLDEIHSGESKVTVKSNGELLRELRVLWLDVYCELSNGEQYYLHEDRQVFKDGRDDPVKVRDLPSSLGEKLKADEDPSTAVTRALEEELGVAVMSSVRDMGVEENTHTPDTYPGLQSQYLFYKYEVVIPESAFIAEGYVEDQPDKTNYYVWNRLFR